MIEQQYGRLAVTPGALIMPLASEELAAFTTDGMLAKRDFVPTDLIQRATSLIADWYRSQMGPTAIVSYTQRTFAPELRQLLRAPLESA